MPDELYAADRRSVLIPDAAHALGLSRRTVYYRIHAGRLMTIRTRCGSQRVLWSSIEALLREAPGAEQRRTTLHEDEAQITRRAAGA